MVVLIESEKDEKFIDEVETSIWYVLVDIAEEKGIDFRLLKDSKAISDALHNISYRMCFVVNHIKPDKELIKLHKAGKELEKKIASEKIKGKK